MKLKILLFTITCSLLLLALAEIHVASAQGPTPMGAQVGKPWRGAPGIKETVAQIMAREQRARKPLPGAPLAVREVPLTGRRSTPRAPSPSAQSLAPSASTRLLTGRLNPQTLGTSFLGAQVSESGLVPPDSMGAVGPSQVLVVVNGRVKVFDRSGTLGSLNTDLSTFFGSLAPISFTTIAYDPQTRYDRLSGRWFVTALDSASPANRILIAVSSSSTISDSTSFNFFSFQHDQVGGIPNDDTGKNADYDSLGVDKNSLYIGVNIFDGIQFASSTAYVVNKSDLISNTLTVTPFRSLAVCNPGCSNGPFSPRGVHNDDPSATEGYFIGVDVRNFSTLTMRRITYSGGIPAISSNILVNVPTTRLPIFGVPSLGAFTGLDGVDDRLFSAQIHKNKLTGANSLWTAHNIEVDSSGIACDDGGIPCADGGRNGSRWYEIGSLSTTPTLVQSGTLYDPSTSNPGYYWIPSVAMSGQGHMALGASFASVNDHAGIAVAGRLYGDASGATQSPTIAQSGLGAYNLGPGNPQRWGDYSQTVVDPNDDMTMWTFQEYVNNTDSWGVRVMQLNAPPPASVSFAAPATIALAQSSVDVVLSGTSISGSGFFDPGADSGGPGFANHITATVSSGVIVNSVTFNTPTQVTLNISTASASNGAANVIVTNPDGQFTTAYCLLLIGNPSPAPSCRLSLPLILK
jgi:hypothetical protein